MSGTTAPNGTSPARACPNRARPDRPGPARAWPLSLVAAALLLAAAAAPSWAIFGANSAAVHDHSTLAEGGPLGNVAISSATVTNNLTVVSTLTVTGTTGIKLQLGSTANTGGNPPLQMSIGGSYQNAVAGDARKSKVLIYDDGTSAAGVGFSSVGGLTQLEYSVSSGFDHAWYGSGIETMRLKNGGKLGIGTASPLAKLSVVGDSSFSQPATFLSSVTVNGAEAFLTVGDDTANTTNGQRGHKITAYSDGKLYLDYKTNSGGTINFRAGEGAEVGYERTWMVVDPTNGNIGMGAASPAARLHVSSGSKSSILVDGSAPISLLFGKRGSAPIAWEALSMDGASQSSGCFVALNMSASGPSGVLTFTSTTTAVSGPAYGVLLETCAPGQYCSVAVSGVVFVNISAASTAGYSPVTSTTRCAAGSLDGSATTVSSGYYFDTGDGTNHAWVLLGAK